MRFKTHQIATISNTETSHSKYGIVLAVVVAITLVVMIVVLVVYQGTVAQLATSTLQVPVRFVPVFTSACRIPTMNPAYFAYDVLTQAALDVATPWIIPAEDGNAPKESITVRIDIDPASDAALVDALAQSCVSRGRRDVILASTTFLYPLKETNIGFKKYFFLYKKGVDMTNLQVVKLQPPLQIQVIIYELVPVVTRPQMFRDDTCKAIQSTQPGSTQPGSTQPGSTQPGSTQPGSTQPGSTQPGSTQPLS